MTITKTLLAGLALSASLALPAFAGGKTVTGATTTTPAAVQSSALRVKFALRVDTQLSLTSRYIEALVQQLRGEYARVLGVDTEQRGIEIINSGS